MRARLSIFVALILTSGGAVHAQPQDKPTREAIIALAEASKAEEKHLDFIAAFGIDFSGLDLSGIDFRGVYRVGYSANLQNADFRGSNLRNAQFGASSLDGADFTGADLSGASFITASLRGAVFLNVNLDGATIRESDLTGATLTGVDVSRSNISGSNFTGANLSKAVLRGTTIEYYRRFSRANLSDADLSGLNLSYGSFTGANLSRADLRGADLVEADFRGADLTNAIFGENDVTHANFRNVTGLSDQQRRDLQSRAARWKYDLRVFASSALTAMFLPAYAATVLAVLIFSVFALTGKLRSTAGLIACVVNVAALAPELLLFAMLFSGGHSTAQLSGGAMDWWSLWFRVWPAAMFVLGACILVASITFLAYVFIPPSRCSNRPRSVRRLTVVYLLLTVAHTLFAGYVVSSYFPNA